MTPFPLLPDTFAPSGVPRAKWLGEPNSWVGNEFRRQLRLPPPAGHVLMFACGWRGGRVSGRRGRRVNGHVGQPRRPMRSAAG
ncbi:MAG: hypothetical protein ACK5F7_14140 [Planctomycetaceae bacterium]